MSRLSRSIVISALLAYAGGSLPASAGEFKAAREKGVPDVYLVTLEKGVARSAKKKGVPAGTLPEVAQVARALGQAHGGTVQEVWEHALHGFLVRMPEGRARQLANDPRVKAVEQDFSISAPVAPCGGFEPAWADPRPLLSSSASPQPIECADPDPANDTSSNPPPACRDNWGPDRVDQQTGRNGFFSFTNNGTGVHVYIMDTGIRWSHREFLNAAGTASRVSGGADASRPDTNGGVAQPGDAVNTDDCHGHGTHVAGILAGRTFGIAKNAAIHPVRVIGGPCGFSGTYSSRVVSALNWIVADHTGNTAVLNWSGGNDDETTGSIAVRETLQGVIDDNIVVVQAAGNQSKSSTTADGLKDACTVSMSAFVSDVIIAGGMDYHDGRWVRPAADALCSELDDCGSNVGSCVDIWAPAAHVVSAARANDNPANDLTCQQSGTSMAAPHVAGAAAIYLQSNPTASPAQVKRALRSRGFWGILQSSASHPNSIGPDSDNVMVYSDTRSAGSDLAPVASLTAVCPGRQCTFDGSGSVDDGTLTYLWRLPDGTTESTSSFKRVFAANSTNNVVLRVTDDTGKTDHLLRTVTVNSDAPPVAAFTSQCTGLACTFDSGTSTDDSNVIGARTWDFGDGATASGAVVTHTYAAAGVYTVALTVADGVGQTNITSEGLNLTIAAPTGIVASASGATVTIQWLPVAGADGYKIERKVSSGAWLAGPTATQSPAIDTPGAVDGVVLYRVRATVGSAESQPSNVDVAYTNTFSDDPLQSGPSAYTMIRAQHVVELRQAVNALGALNGVATPFTGTALQASTMQFQPIHYDDFTLLRDKLNAARQAAGLAAIAAFSPVPAPAVGVAPSHLNALRAGLK